MVLIQLTGQITETGKLEIELPKGLPAGKVHVTIEAANEENSSSEACPWTDAEIQEMIQPKPVSSGAEIVAMLEAEGGWEDLGITDGAEWVQEQRRKHERKFPEW